MQIILLCVCTIFILLNGLEMCRARNDNRTHLVCYQREGYDLHTFPLMVKSLSQELSEGNDDVLSCGESASICIKPGKCVPELLEHDVKSESICSMLVYQYEPLQQPNVLVEQISPNNANLVNAEQQEFTTELPAEHEKPTPSEVWGFGILSVGIISLSGLFGVVFWPLMKTNIYAQMMWVLIGLAVGSLTASATFQLIPEGFKLKEHGDDYLTTALFMWTSFWLLYMIETLAKIYFHTEDEEHQEETIRTPSIVVASSPLVQKTFRTTASINERSCEDLEQDDLLPSMAIKNGNLSPPPTSVPVPLYMSQGSLHNLTYKKSSHNHSHGKKSEGDGKIASVAWMIIFGDGIHNFIDGMSIGAGFSQSIAVGTSISIAIACEEFPHELGDFAILINSGMSVKRALLYNFLSACTAFAGLVLGILLGQIDASVYIFAFAGGLFLYIALTDLMPELNEMIAAGLVKGRKYALFVLLLQNVGILTGATILYLVTRLPINIS